MDEESIHDLRVSLARMDSLLDLVRLFLPKQHVRKTRRRLRKLRNAVGPLRDVQVHIALTRALEADFTDLSKFQKHLERKEQRLSKDLKKTLRARHSRLRKSFEKTVRQSRDLLRMFTRVEVERTMGHAIDRAYSTLTAAKRSILDSHDLAAIHELRKSFKRFRYAVEVSDPILHELSNTLNAQMRDLQKVMGDIRDNELLFGLMTRWGSRRKAKRRKSAPLYQTMLARRRECLERFAAKVDEIDSLRVDAAAPPVLTTRLA